MSAGLLAALGKLGDALAERKLRSANRPAPWWDEEAAGRREVEIDESNKLRLQAQELRQRARLQ